MSAKQTSDNTELVVGGFIPLSTTDLPGELSAVVFCQGCPWHCAYCHNPHLIPSRREGILRWQDVLSFLQKRKGLLDAVVFSGGEPTMQPALHAAMREVREMGFKLGLHTAGQYPDRLKTILPLLTWVGMDIKAPFGKSSQVTGREVRDDDGNLRESAALILASGVNYEFRTTVHSALLSESDIIQITDDLKALGAARYVIQEFRSNGCRNEALNNAERTFTSVPMQIMGKFNHFEFRPASMER